MSAKSAMEQAKANWEMYYTLSQELLKFINKQDIDEFLELTQQREAVVTRMKALPETEEYRKTAECQALIERIKPLDMQIIYKAKSWLNKSKRQNATVHAYDLQEINPLGNILNKKY
ncbi:MAG: flagellar protein FliT [Selenomonas sp.]|uniref:flagellar protein FliT n=1 Tax=Selenomonas sp. TaxID=2053611 RepID=UPI0025D09FB4|nr:flagellar protein FliT [Selenomonas sp.]MCR5438270.1 flagellar protein FliT [Selenomonas sp.]